MELRFQNGPDFLRALQQCQDMEFDVLDHQEFVIEFFSRWQFDFIEMWCIARNMAFVVIVYHFASTEDTPIRWGGKPRVPKKNGPFQGPHSGVTPIRWSGKASEFLFIWRNGLFQGPDSAVRSRGGEGQYRRSRTSLRIIYPSSIQGNFLADINFVSWQMSQYR